MASYQPSKLIIGLIFVLAIAGCRDSQHSSVRTNPIELDQNLRNWHRNKLQLTSRQTTQLIVETRMFLDSPSAENRRQWQAALISAHESYLGSTIIFAQNNGAHQRIDSWPIQPGFVDSLIGYPESGIVNDSTLKISSATLQQQHLITDDDEIALGFHLLEYYAFERRIESFSGVAVNADRRRRLILLVADLLLLDLLAFQKSIELAAPDDAASRPSSSADLLIRLASRSQLIFSECNRMGEHGVYSRRSPQNIGTQLMAIKDILNEPVGFNHILIELDADKAKIFNKTLDEAIRLIPANGAMNEADSSRLLLLVSAVSHQLEDLALGNL